MDNLFRLEDVMTLKEAARYHNIKYKTLQKAIERGHR